MSNCINEILKYYLVKPKTFVMMVGAPGSGKTIMRKFLAENFANIEVICPDDIRAELFNNENDQTHNKEVFVKVYQRLVKSLDDGHVVVYDATNCNSIHRNRIFSVIKSHYDDIICLVSNATLSECLQGNAAREKHVPEEVIERMYMNLKKYPPSIFEGYSAVIAFDRTDCNA